MTHFIGICDGCRETHVFSTAEARDEYETGHPHGSCEGCQHRQSNHEYRLDGIGPCCEDNCQCKGFAR